MSADSVVDGVLETLTDDSLLGTGAAAYDGVAAVEIGRYNGSNAQCFDGKIGDVWVYNRVLGANEVMRVYQATKWRYK